MYVWSLRLHNEPNKVQIATTDGRNPSHRVPETLIIGKEEREKVGRERKTGGRTHPGRENRREEPFEVHDTRLLDLRSHPLPPTSCPDRPPEHPPGHNRNNDH